MKKLIAIVITAVYVILMSGITVHLHYCKGDLKHVGILETLDNCCNVTHACDGDVLHHSCCDNENISLKLDVEQNVVQHFELPLLSVIALPFISHAFENLDSEVKQILHFTDSGPPLVKSLYKLYSSYIFYA